MHEERNFVPDKTPKKPSSGSTSSYYSSDPYDVWDYDAPDDFADEWAEEFGDGNYDDGMKMRTIIGKVNEINTEIIIGTGWKETTCPLFYKCLL